MNRKPGFSPGAVGDSIFFDVKTDFRSWRLGRRRRRVEDFHDALEDIHDSGLMNIQTDFELLLKQDQFSGEYPSVTESGAHFNKSAHDEDAHLGCLGAC